mmetsp:Transcript_16835/g.52280  ORF Transcript_16835/g.52280 Transcript_16835/m.52280 type:complete len:242 (-) Transcript_16835:95-820(-)
MQLAGVFFDRARTASGNAVAIRGCGGSTRRARIRGTARSRGSRRTWWRMSAEDLLRLGVPRHELREHLFLGDGRFHQLIDSPVGDIEVESMVERRQARAQPLLVLAAVHFDRPRRPGLHRKVHHIVQRRAGIVVIPLLQDALARVAYKEVLLFQVDDADDAFACRARHLDDTHHQPARAMILLHWMAVPLKKNRARHVVASGPGALLPHEVAGEALVLGPRLDFCRHLGFGASSPMRGTKL